MTDIELTIINNIKIYQPTNGYRFSNEPFILTMDIFSHNKVFVDFGSGCGVIAVLTAKTDKSSMVYAVEKNGQMRDLIKKNMMLNNIDNIEIVENFSSIETNSVDCILSNPPYFAKGNYRESNKFFNEKFENDTLENFFSDAKRVLRNKGTLKISFHPTRIVELIDKLDVFNFGIKSITPVYGQKDKQASFIVVESKFNTKHHTLFKKAIFLKES